MNANTPKSDNAGIARRFGLFLLGAAALCAFGASQGSSSHSASSATTSPTPVPTAVDAAAPNCNNAGGSVRTTRNS